jgi:hypothetical protein
LALRLTNGAHRAFFVARFSGAAMRFTCENPGAPLACAGFAKTAWQEANFQNRIMTMMSSKMHLLAISLVALNLVACGGGGGGGSSAQPGEIIGPGTSTDFSPVAGLYDASVERNNLKDESYLYISSEGKITAYNYMGDSIDAGNNCYREASGSDINAAITGKTLTYSAADSRFSTTVGSTPLYWELDTNKKLSKINYGGSISGSNLVFSSGGTSLAVRSTTITTPKITDITSALCK